MAIPPKNSVGSAKTKTPATTPVSRSETKGSGTATALKPVPTPVATPAATRPAAKITYEQIATRAYEIYLKRGFGPGNALSDWTEAERQLKAGR